MSRVHLYCANCGHRECADDEVCKACESRDRYENILTTLNHARLRAYARLARASVLRRALVTKLGTSRVVTPDVLGSDIATLNSRITFEVLGRPRESRILVSPDASPTFGRDLPVITPIGMALLGLTANRTAVFSNRDEDKNRVRLIRVDYQPEAANRLSIPGRADTTVRDPRPSMVTLAHAGHAPLDAHVTEPSERDPGPDAA